MTTQLETTRKPWLFIPGLIGVDRQCDGTMVIEIEMLALTVPTELDQLLVRQSRAVTKSVIDGQIDNLTKATGVLDRLENLCLAQAVLSVWTVCERLRDHYGDEFSKLGTRFPVDSLKPLIRALIRSKIIHRPLELTFFWAANPSTFSERLGGYCKLFHGE